VQHTKERGERLYFRACEAYHESLFPAIATFSGSKRICIIFVLMYSGRVFLSIVIARYQRLTDTPGSRETESVEKSGSTTSESRTNFDMLQSEKIRVILPSAKVVKYLLRIGTFKLRFYDGP